VILVIHTLITPPILFCYRRYWIIPERRKENWDSLIFLDDTGKTAYIVPKPLKKFRVYSRMRRTQTAQSDFLPNKAVFRRRAAAQQGKSTRLGGKYAGWMGADHFGIGS
jgi:hypothetical protein